ncbi:M14 family metallopeptidase [Kribbella yunnanensis]|uniref:M14 family metallopeptidase n=1 Tax=Kribbella yunnanensis TaxID=190194 RepID=A0ABP4RXA0_9ACTN
MSLLRVVGTAEVLEGLRDIEELDLDPDSARLWTDGVKWRIAAMAPPTVIPVLEQRGCDVYELMSDADLLAYYDEIGSPPPTETIAFSGGVTPGPLLKPRRASEIEAGLDALASKYKDYCKRIMLETTSGGNKCSYLKIGVGPSGPKRPVVLFTGGLHGREWVPPDALLSLAENLLAAYHDGADLYFPATTISFRGDKNKPLPSDRPQYFPEYVIKAETIVPILRKVDLLIFPLANPDGREFDLDHPKIHKYGWRKSRRSVGPDPKGNPAHGVDINRNFPIGWDFDRYYQMGLYRARYGRPPSDKTPGDGAVGELYRGSAPLSEIETRNVATLMETYPISYFVDVHTAGRAIMWSWGMEENGTNPAMTYRNPVYDGTRDGLMADDPKFPVGRVDYKEYLPPRIAERNEFISRLMASAILRSANRGELPASGGFAEYHTVHLAQQDAKPWLAFGGPLTSTSQNYATALQFIRPDRPPTYACVFEAGDDEEGLFHPVYAAHNPQFQKQNREIQSALIALLQSAATFGVQS